MTEPETSIPALTIQLFGPMQVRVQGQPLPPLRSRRILWLLALLTLRPNRPVEREWLATTLWPDLDRSQAFDNMRPVLSGLRSALGTQAERLQSPSRRTLLLDLTDTDVDVRTFDAALALETLTAQEQAVGLYRGPLLEGCNEEWVFQERAVREQCCLQALKTLGNAAVSAGDYATAVGHFQRAVGIDAWQETARRGWMEALAKSGDTHAALRVYREFVEVLRSNPRAVPDEKTSALYQRLRAEVRQRTGAQTTITAETVVVPKVQGYLPHPLTNLVGREDERLEVAIQLRRSRLVTLTGVGGIGKTRLAQEVAGEVVREYADGVWLVGLETLSEGRLVIQQIASVLGLREERGRTPLQSVMDHLRQKRLLLVLDNCEHLLEASAQVAAHLLRECGEVRILATSREALGITGETVWSVPALAVPDGEQLPQGQATLVRVLMGYEGVQLFVERAQSVQQSFVLSGSNARTVAQACRQLEGVPLAIELAAARVRAMSVEQIASRLEDYLGLLTGGSRTAQSRQQTLRATLDWSYDLLNEPERSLLRRLSVFAGGCLLDAAERVCSGESVEEGQVLNLLTSLVDKSLVLFEAREPAERRYRLLEMVRQYAAASLQACGEIEQVKRKHRDWCVSVAEEEMPRLRTAELEMALRRLETEHENFRAALAWCRAEENGAQFGLRLAGTLWRFWGDRGYVTEGRRYLGEALERKEAIGRSPERARALNSAGSLAISQGDYASARSLSEESLGIWRELGNQQGIAASLNTLGLVAFSHSDFASARTLFEESLAIQRELGDRYGIAISLSNLGIVAKDQGDYASACVLYEESLAIRRELGDKRGIAISLNNLGNVTLDLGDFASARPLLEESLAIRRELGNQQGVAASLNNLGTVAGAQGDYASACVLYEESLAIRRELGDKRGIATSLNNLGDVASMQGDYVSARSLHEESLGINRELKDKRGIATSLNNLGTVAGGQNDYASACVLYEESLTIRRELGDKRGIAESLGNLGDVAILQGDYTLARGLHAESLGINRELENRYGIALSLDAFARLAFKEERGERAARLWGAASALRESIGSRLPPDAQEDQERDVAAARTAMGAAAFVAAREKGRDLTWEQAITAALESDPMSEHSG